MNAGKLRPRPAATVRPTYSKTFTPGSNDIKQTRALDDLALFDELQTTLIPELRKAIKAGKDTKEILQIGKAAALARLVSLATMNPDDKSALAAVKELLDRLDGKATEKKDITHRLAKLPDEEIDALLLTSASDLEGNDDGEAK